MYGNIFSLAFQGVRRKKKSSILIFMVLLLSFSFAIASLAQLGSMSKTNAEFRLNTYGEWYFGIPAGKEQDAKWLEKESWAEKVGISKSFGTVAGAERSTGFGTVDDMLKEIGRLKLDDGTWPANANEIAMEADILGLLGYDYTLGQEITLQIAVPAGETPIIVEQKFILCGVIREYTDLWVLNMNTTRQLLNGAVVTEEAANQVLEAAQTMLGGPVSKPVPQYFIVTAEENRKPAMDKLQEYMRDPARGGVDPWPCENSAAYSSSIDEETKETMAKQDMAENNFYVYAIAAVALLAVICIYIMQLPAETHSFAVLRSIGITKGQMARLLFTESLLLCVPAMIFGVPLGMGLIWLALKLTMYSGSVPVQVDIPFETIGKVIFLWILMILLSRLIVFCVTVRTPLTGAMQMQRGKSRRARVLRSSFIVLLLSIFGAVTIFTSVQALSPKTKMEIWGSYAPYTISIGSRSSFDNNINPCVLEPQLTLIEQVPGISNTVGFSAMQIAVSFDGREIGKSSIGGSQMTLWMYALDAADWEDVFDFGTDREAFDRGELVLLCFPDEKHPTAETEDFLLPSGEIQVMTYYGPLYKDNGHGDPVTPKPPLRFASEPTPVSVQRIPYNVQNRQFIFDAPYTVICSNAYIEKLTRLLPPREPGESNFEPQWESFSIDREVGYEDVQVFTDRNAGDLFTDKVMAQLCSRNSFAFNNRRQEYAAHIQENLQKLILLCSSGICIACMSLLICYGALSLETEQEKRYFRTMRIIGMSSKQMTGKIMGKALYRSGIAVLSGWIFYFGYLTIRGMQNELSFGAAVHDVIPHLMMSMNYYGKGMVYLGVLTLICLLIPLVLSLFAKLKLRKESWIS